MSYHLRVVPVTTLLNEISERCLGEDPEQEIADTIKLSRPYIKLIMEQNRSNLRMHRRSLSRLFKMAERYNCPCIINLRDHINND